ncbi:dihydrofolate reductase [Marasmius fiardii PR-910]|nr:dihydrofolate reductase [Marasmius fiardii PR-910]
MAFEPQPPSFLKSLLRDDDLPKSRPRVTVTFAQSIDGKIAGVKGKQLILSGKESMIMTHWMRTMHDGIMIGIGTALNDNPQLNTRHLPNPSKNPLPRPIVLDSNLRLDPACKLLVNFQNGQGRRPWVLCSEPDESEERNLWETRRGVLDQAGAGILVVPVRVLLHDSRLSLTIFTDFLNISACLKLLREKGIRSVMVEGGAGIIKSFFAEEFSQNQGIIDNIVITVAPTFVGSGVGYNIDVEEDTRFVQVTTEILGRDTVVAFSRMDDRLR